MLPKYYEFYLPLKINSGQDALETLCWEMEQMGVNKPLILTDKGIVKAGLLDIFLKVIKDCKSSRYVIYDSIPSDSSIEVINEVARIFKKNNCDSFIALGGGSVIDTGKGANILVSHNTDDLKDLMGVERLQVSLLKPLFVIPTTSGTGSEATLVAVISHPKENIKLPFVSYKIVPRLAILDPRMTITLPPKLTAATGMDTLTHAIEAYTCLQKNPISDAFAWSSIELIGKYLIKAVKNGKDRQARFAMANASLMAGIAFSNSMVGAVHALGHALGAVAHVHHGNAMAILLPYVMEENMQNLEHLYSKLLLPLAGEEVYFSISKDNRAKKLIEFIHQMNDELNKYSNMPIRLSELGLDKKLFPKIAEKAINDGAMSTNPIDFSIKQVIRILEKAM